MTPSINGWRRLWDGGKRLYIGDHSEMRRCETYKS